MNIELFAQTTIQFSGISWNVRNGSGGPGPNNWSNSKSSVWVDTEGQLHLKIQKIDNKWYCAEVNALESFGYGEYRFYVSSNVENYDPEIVAGLFTYETDTREIDIEFSRWGDPASISGWYIVQPASVQSRHSYALNLAGAFSTHKFVWSKNSCYFQSYHGHYATLPSDDFLISEWNYAGSNIPPAGKERLHINFWLVGGHVPVNKQEAELVIKSVFVPTNTSLKDKPVTALMRITPNPFSDKISIEVSERMKQSTLLIYDLSGCEITKHIGISNHTQIDLSHLSSGVYIAKLIWDNGMEVLKIIKK